MLGAVSLALLAGFVARQRTAATPLMALRIFRSRNVTGANVVQVLMVAGLFGMFFLGALYLQGIQGYSPIEVGLAYLPVALLIGTVSMWVADKLIMRFGARTVLVAGLSSVLAGLLLFTRAPLEATYVTDVLPTMVLFGVGAGLSFPALMTLAMSGATPEDAGLASGLVNTTQQVGGALGLAVLSTFSATHTEDRLADGASRAGGAGGRLPAGVHHRRRVRRGGDRLGGDGAGAHARDGDRGAARRGARGGRRSRLQRGCLRSCKAGGSVRRCARRRSSNAYARASGST